MLNAESYCQLSNQNDNEEKKKKKPSSDLSAIHIHTSGRVASPPATIVHKFGPTTTLTRPYSPHNSSFFSFLVSSISVDTLKYVTSWYLFLYILVYFLLLF